MSEPGPSLPSPRRRRWWARRELLLVVHLLLGLVLLSPAYIRPDSVGTYSWLRSAVVDGDLLFYNEWAAFEMYGEGFPRFKEVTEHLTLANHWGIGTSLLAAPVYLVLWLMHVLLGLPEQAQGFFGIFGIGLSLTTVLFVAGALMLLDSLMSSRGATRMQRLAVSLGVWLGTPLFWYEFRYPLGTHAAGALAVGVLCWLLARGNWERDETALATGLVFGLAVATRIQHLVLLPALLYFLWSGGGRRSRIILITALGAVLPGLIQALAWFAVYDSPLGPLTAGANLAGSTWAPLQRITFDAVLLSSYHGLLSWSPVICLSLAGWWLGRIDHRRLSLTMILMFLFELAANSTADRYFWGGLAFGARRFVDLAVPFGFGLWLFVKSVRPRYGYPAVALLTTWSILLTGSAIGGRLDLLRDVSPGQLFQALFPLHAFSSETVKRLGAPVQYPEILPAYALSMVAVIAVALVILGLRHRLRLLLALAFVLLAVAAAHVTLTIGPTRSRASAEFRSRGLQMPLAGYAGPLLDQKALLEDEVSYYRRIGREASAEKTEEELRQIERILRTRSESR